MALFWLAILIADKPFGLQTATLVEEVRVNPASGSTLESVALCQNFGGAAESCNSRQHVAPNVSKLLLDWLVLGGWGHVGRSPM